MASYAMYLRKSRADLDAEAHGQGETLLRHETALKELAKKMNLPITAIYREVVSGETIDARPQIQKLLSEIEGGEYDGVLVMDVDRLARGDTIDQGIIARAFRLSDTKIITPKKVYDPQSEFDEEYFEFELFMSRREYKMISRRIQRGRIASVNDGKFIGSTPPYGYDKVKIKNGKGFTLEPNAEADTVKMIFDMYLQGDGCTVIANQLDELGFRTRSGRAWSKSSISDILSNPVYMGKIRWSHRPDIKTVVNNTVVKKRTANENCILVDGVHEPLISAEVFEKAQKLIGRNRKAPVKASTTLQNPLTGLIYCKQCGSRMTRLGQNKRNRYDTIKCTNRKCDCVSAPLYLVEDLVIETLTSWLKQYSVMAGKSTPPIKMVDMAEVKQREIESLRADIETIDVQISNTYDLLEQGVYTTEVFMQRNKYLSERKQKSVDRVCELEKEIKDIKDRHILKEKIIPMVKRVINSYYECRTAEEKNALLKSVITRIEYSKTTPNRRGHIDNANFEITLHTIVSEEISL